MELILENIRCFAERQTIPVKPLTLLVGENSAGKSTFLACLSAASDPFGFPLRPRFNERPYNLGNYDTIATNRGGRAGLATSFSLGYSNELPNGGDTLHVLATYQESKGAVELARMQVSSEGILLDFALLSQDKVEITATLKDTEPVVYDLGVKSFTGGLLGRVEFDEFIWLAKWGLQAVSHEEILENKHPLIRAIRATEALFGGIILPEALSIAPIRSEPKRTYTEVVEEFSPTGEHVPYVLEDVLQDPASRKLLEDFGRESGLFSKVAVKLWGKKRSDPLSVMVTNEGRAASSASNLSDVGYGVSQALPLVVQSVLAAPESRLLLQQPEVHLHPRAQAALGTLFVDLVATSKKQFVVETHSDYILDRVRQEVARGKIAASDVQILYFEREKQGTHIYPIDLDDLGNIINAPSSYRSFFLREEMNLLTRGSRNGTLK